MSPSIDPRSARSSALVDADTQFDFDLSEVLDQYPDAALRGAGGAVVAEVPVKPAPDVPANARPVTGAIAEEAALPAAPVVPVGDPWVVAPNAPAAPPKPAAVAAGEEVLPSRPAPFGAVVAATNAAARHAVPQVVPVVPPATTSAVPVVDGRVDLPTGGDGTSVSVPAGGAGAAVATAVDVRIDPAVARAVDPPPAVHSVFVTPPAGTPIVGAAAMAPTSGSAVPVRPAKARRRSGLFVALAGILALALIGSGVGLALATRDDDGAGDAAATTSPDQSVALPPADATKPADDAPAAPAPDATAVDAAALEQAADAVTTFLSLRGTDAERTVSSQVGRDEFTAAIAASGATSAQGAPECSVGDAAGTVACVLATDQGALTLTVGADPDDPASSGFEVIDATA